MTANQTRRNTSKDALRDVLTWLETEGAALGHFRHALWIRRTPGKDERTI